MSTRSDLPMRPLVQASWRRVRATGLDPEANDPPYLVRSDRLREQRVEHPVATALPAVRDLLLGRSRDAGHALAISDVNGDLLWLEGSRSLLKRTARIGMAPGARWSEWGVGTNAIGTALHERRPVEITFDEHYLHTHKDWGCWAAPVHDPVSGDPLAILDISGPQASPDKLLLVRSVARLVESMLRERRRDQLLVIADAASLAGLDPRTSAVLDAEGHRLWGRADLRLPLGFQPADIAEQPHGPPIRLDRFGGFWVVHAPAGAPKDVLLRVLGPLPPAAFLAGKWVELSSRHADILYLLSRSAGGMTADELAQELYGDSGNPLTVRVEMHRIRALLGDRIASAPYRFVVPVGTDADAILALVAQGRVLDAVDRYTGQLLPRSDSLAVELLRAELNQAVRWAVLRAGGPALDRWCAGPVGNSDAEALTARMARLSPTDPMVPILLARLARIAEAAG